MADSKLSALTELATTPADVDEFYVNDGGVSKRITYGTIKTAFATSAQGSTADSALQNVSEDTTPQLGGNLDVNGNKIVSASSGDIDIEPNGTGNVLLGNFTFDADQTVGAGQDNYVLTYDNAAGTISLEAAAGGWANMTEAVWAGGTQSEVADGASAVAFDFDTDNAYTTSGAEVFRVSNNGTKHFAIDKDGYINIGADGRDWVIKNAARSLMTITDGGGNSPIQIGAGSSVHGFGSGVAIGRNTSTDGQSSVAIGSDADTTGGAATAIALGYSAKANKHGAVAISGGNFTGAVADHRAGFALSGEGFSANGDNQFLLWQPAATTTDATPANLFLDEDGAAERMTLAAGKTYFFEAHVCGIQSDGTDACYFTRKGIISRTGSTTALIGSVGTIGTDIESNASTDVAITADDTNEALQIQVTGIAAETWRWSANVFVKDITQGT